MGPQPGRMVSQWGLALRKPVGCGARTWGGGALPRSQDWRRGPARKDQPRLALGGIFLTPE